ncbi:cation transport ATPase [Ceratobasidium sp. AG-Ba]|nr:cation transport ATPase [Ceratobasidium sp. AG-Ba]
MTAAPAAPGLVNHHHGLRLHRRGLCKGLPLSRLPTYANATQDIAEVAAIETRGRRRRDSQVSVDGAVFDGPQAALFPSSVSSFHHERRFGSRRRQSVDSRRQSMESRRRQSTESQVQSPDEDIALLSSDGEEETPASPKLTRQSGMFSSWTGLFRARSPSQASRPTLSRRTSAASNAVSDTSVAGWDDAFGSEPSASPLPSPTASLPILTGGGDPFFGDARIDISPPPSLYDDHAKLPESRQNVYVADEDARLRLTGYLRVGWRNVLWHVMTVLTLGVLALVGRWIPRMWLRFVSKEVPFMDATFVVVETEHSDFLIQPIETISYPYPLETIFNPIPSSINQTPGTATPLPDAQTALAAIASRDPSLKSAAPSINGVPNGHGSTLTNGNGSSFGNGNGSSTLVPPNGTSNGNGHSPTLKPIPSPEHLEKLGTLSYIDYRYTRFVLDPRTRQFTMLRNWRDRTWASLPSLNAGLDTGTRVQRGTAFGTNEVEIEAKGTIALLVDEVLHPFYVFQVASIILWSLDDYYYYAFCIALISALSVGTTLIETKKTIRRMREMSRFECPVGVLVDGEWQTISSTQLVPGDTVSLMSPSLSTVPADILLLSGDAIVNESMLTGESVPVSKIPVGEGGVRAYIAGAGKADSDIGPELAKSFLYAGTRVVRVRGVGEHGVALGVVARTGFNTTKGALVRSMLFPKPMGFKFYRDSMRFIAVLAGIAILGFLASSVQFIKLGIAWQTIVVRALDLITIVVPPALPATLSIGTAFAIARLRSSGVFCIAPTRVNVGGKVDVVCFDKTGTLTEDGLDVLGVRGVEGQTGGSSGMFGELVQSVHELPLPRGKSRINVAHALATCHQLKVVDGEVIGDPLDVKMFEFTGWEVEEGRVGPKRTAAGGSEEVERPATLVQTIVRPPGSGKFRLEDAMKTGTRHAHFLELGVIRTFEFVSALRRMSVVVKRLKSTSMEIYVKGAPEVMGDICDPDSFPGDYDDMLSYYTKHGYRVIALAGKSVENLSWLKAQKMKREQAESNLRFLGLIIFENKLKPGTAPAIQTLRDAHLVCRMVTGDNPRTAVSVARECGLISQSAHVFYAVFAEGNAQTPQSRLHWSSVDDASLTLDDYSLKPLLPRAHHTIEEEISYQDYTLAVSGDVFRWMVNHAPLETLQRMLVKGQIFARMSPDEKHELVSRLQSLGYTVAFCGDGANDCGALKAADVGLSLSEAEASVAAPFTSRTPDIGCVIEVFLYIDLFIIIPIAVTMGRTLPYPRIHPKRPTASLVSKKVLSSIIGQILITSGFQFWAFFWIRGQPWYTPPVPSSPEGGLETFNYENTALFLISSYQYILVAAVFSIGPPYRRPMWTNVLLMASIIALTLFSTLVLFAPPQPIRILLDIMEIPSGAKMTLFVAAVLNAAVCFGFERWNPIAAALEVLSRGRRRRTKGGLEYRAVEGGMVGGWVDADGEGDE